MQPVIAPPALIDTVHDRLLEAIIDRTVDRRLERTRLSWDGTVPLPASRPAFGPLREVFRIAAKRLLPHLIEADLDFAAGHRLEAAEDWYSEMFDTQGVELFGRIDRITFDPVQNAFTLVDYKKNRIPGKGDFDRLIENESVSTDVDDGEIGEVDDESDVEPGPVDSAVLQIAIYAALTRAKERKLDRAAFYSIETAHYQTVFNRRGGSPLDDAAMGKLESVVLGIASRTAGRIREGDYRVVAADGAAACAACPSRSVCRARYIVRTP